MLCNVCRNEGDRIYIIPVLHLHAVQPPMYVLHEVVKVYSCFGPDGIRKRIVEQIHQHSLAAAHISKQVEPSGEALRYVFERGLFRLAAAEKRKERFGWLEILDARVDDWWSFVLPELLMQTL